MKRKAWKITELRCTKLETRTRTNSRPSGWAPTAFLSTLRAWSTNSGELQFDLDIKDWLQPSIGIKLHQ